MSGFEGRQGRIQDFKLGGAHLKNCAERREARKFWGYFVWKITIFRQNIIFFFILGGARAGYAPPMDSPLGMGPGALLRPGDYSAVKTDLSPLTFWVRFPLRRGVLDTTLCDKVCQRLAAGRWFSAGIPVSSTNKTVRHDITEILLNVALNTINQPTKPYVTIKLYTLQWFVILF